MVKVYGKFQPLPYNLFLAISNKFSGRCAEFYQGKINLEYKGKIWNLKSRPISTPYKGVVFRIYSKDEIEGWKFWTQNGKHFATSLYIQRNGNNHQFPPYSCNELKGRLIKIIEKGKETVEMPEFPVELQKSFSRFLSEKSSPFKHECLNIGVFLLVLFTFAVGILHFGINGPMWHEEYYGNDPGSSL